ncbi:hypothetical protein D3C78_504050 [compost metagenome]
MKEMQVRERFVCRPVLAQRSQTGFSLIELMVASAIGLMIMAAILTLYLNVVRTNEELAKTNALVENGRFAIQLLQDDIAHAGFWDGYMPDFEDLTLPVAQAPSDIFTSAPNLCLKFDSWTGGDYFKRRLGVAVQVHQSNTVPTGCADVVKNRKNDTDILVVRHASTCTFGDAECGVYESGDLNFQSSRCDEDEDAGGNQIKYVLTKGDEELHELDCVTPVAKRRFIYNIYYVRDYAVTVGDGIPTLVRSGFGLDGVADQTPDALIEGVERFRVELGVDHVSDDGIDIVASTGANNYKSAVKWKDPDVLDSPVNRGDGSPDKFVNCGGGCSVDNLVNVVAVKLHVLVRSQTATQGYSDGKTYSLGGQTFSPNDGFKRHLFSTVVRLNNVAGRRETP